MCLFFWVLVAGSGTKPCPLALYYRLSGASAAGLQGYHDRTKVMLEHRDIAFRRAAPFRQGVRRQAAADLLPGFL